MLNRYPLIALAGGSYFIFRLALISSSGVIPVCTLCHTSHCQRRLSVKFEQVSMLGVTVFRPPCEQRSWMRGRKRGHSVGRVVVTD